MQTTAAHTVAQHYNARPQVGVDARKDSSIIQLKNLHNWIKSVLIRKYVRRGDTVLDFCCGKGGDLQKWIKADVGHLVGADIAAISIQHAIERCRERNPRFSAKFFALDCFVESVVPAIVLEESVDLVSCQFALHYCAENEKKFNCALDNIAGTLKPGGYFICTIPDCYRLIKRLESSPSLSFGNSKYSVRFETKNQTLYGHKYFFQLEDAIDDCPEYVFHFPTFVQKAAERGLEVVYEKPFHELFNEEVENMENLTLLYKMRVLDNNGTISADEWEVSGIYKAVAMRKKAA
ncbi:mRNA cap guanine-N7 methyltransferase [Physocladia obscura]|uniref:mRNA cap guanine-N(7) methyltransferase n=1 Tax=Physocladia obscura TaxID=109957 RepID=A0AAD5XG42_9FUNG|nr:mRNA cap guanine-N7 methyltransferase [Physocladia obscura]